MAKALLIVVGCSLACCLLGFALCSRMVEVIVFVPDETVTSWTVDGGHEMEKHIFLLKRDFVLEVRREGQTRRYQITDSASEVYLNMGRDGAVTADGATIRPLQ